MKQPVQIPRGARIFLGNLICRLELPEYFGFAYDHGIQSAGNAKQMTGALGRFIPIQRRIDNSRMRPEQRIEILKRPPWKLRDRKIFHAVAGRNNHRLRQSLKRSQLGMSLRDLISRNGKSLTKRNIRDVMADTGANNVHDTATVKTARRFIATRTPSAAKKIAMEPIAIIRAGYRPK